MTGVRTNFTYCHRGSRGQAKLGGILASMLLMAMMTTHVLAISSALLSSDSRARGELLSSINRLRGSIEVKVPVAVEEQVVAASDSSTLPGFPGLDVLECMREYNSHVAATIDDFTAARPARLSPELALFSRATQNLEVTVVTAFSTSRLYMLEGLCASWQGPLSAAVYQGVHQGSEDAASKVQQAKANVKELFERTESRNGCQLDIVLYSELMASSALVEVLYPLNVLRNVALLMARTDLVFVIDGDMVISSDLAANLANPTRFADVKHQCEDKKFMVIPAFDTKNASLANRAAAEGKKMSLDAFESEELAPFLKYEFEPAHAPTNFTRWFTATKNYNIEHNDGYIVNADSFIVHRPHASTTAKASFMADIKRGHKQQETLTIDEEAVERRITEVPLVLLHNVTANFYGAFKWQLSQGSYETLLTEGFERCRQQLPWWQDDQMGAALAAKAATDD